MYQGFWSRGCNYTLSFWQISKSYLNQEDHSHYATTLPQYDPMKSFVFFGKILRTSTLSISSGKIPTLFTGPY